ncbi:tail protein [Dinoroseobacter phage vB_DshS-R4C]|uniref:Tail protein n=1 Tax=Dinoroseobacter phage vB_DshS-R4C TaxID=2590919 RepID=A0ACD6BAB5_9CAUD|nr:Chain G, Distal tail protein [Dinoroseobacter phage vB_DshS-R4C]8GTC_H Chain H, Distal tail protein [Dinoroseobacter phage vB_DshS-R4C]8GTC_I Chain I, Distal tail protein [Dinoroseobacter phage vB_DshS-R4C]8GTC_J Chain J, Distal tail protein [Dinoroseobacter phage vB_DshS-R4C]8GTC_K Chain K, Distal tail protein [Dinoroseobacter phage vB_DshS-R4C]8GTC_L Chain L, Distal tail protein [Dinoroseobacter phage vB_DshS-R4C]QDF14261.1 tail protein [Dinoroseobacter phage vB_DshS-R4C]
MQFIDVEFPRDIAAGCQAVLTRRDEVVTLASGREEVNSRWADTRRSWDAGLGVRDEADLAQVVALFEEVRGRLYAFRFRDWLDWRTAATRAPITATDQPLGLGDGSRTAFQVVKVYGAVNPYTRPLSLPHPGTVRVALDGVTQPSGWTLTAPGGVITFDTPPALGVTVTAGCSFDVPVRFSDPELAVQWAYFREGQAGLAQAPSIPLIEVRLDP